MDFRYGVARVKRFVHIHLHCIVKNVRRIGKILTLPPGKISVDAHGCSHYHQAVITFCATMSLVWYNRGSHAVHSSTINTVLDFVFQNQKDMLLLLSYFRIIRCFSVANISLKCNRVCNGFQTKFVRQKRDTLLMQQGEFHGRNFVVKYRVDSLVWNQCRHQVDAEVKFYKIIFPLLFPECFESNTNHALLHPCRWFT